ncbi:hypothetical protein WAI453_013361 [Rhynchosporium graminicola]
MHVIIPTTLSNHPLAHHLSRSILTNISSYLTFRLPSTPETRQILQQIKQGKRLSEIAQVAFSMQGEFLAELRLSTMPCTRFFNVTVFGGHSFE